MTGTFWSIPTAWTAFTYGPSDELHFAFGIGTPGDGSDEDWLHARDARVGNVPFEIVAEVTLGIGRAVTLARLIVVSELDEDVIRLGFERVFPGTFGDETFGTTPRASFVHDGRHDRRTTRRTLVPNRLTWADRRADWRTTPSSNRRSSGSSLVGSLVESRDLGLRNAHKQSAQPNKRRRIEAFVRPKD